MKKITVLIPCLNEASAIGSVISRFPYDKLAASGYSLSVVVIDNNSTDHTAEAARQAGAQVLFEPKGGKGFAMRTGFQSIMADTDFVVMLDGDGTYRPEEVLRLIEPIDSGFAEVIVGSRMFGHIKDGSMKRLNRIGNRMYSQLVRSGYGVTVTDVLTGYFAWSRGVVERMRPHLTSPGFALEMEMITKMARLGYAVYSVPISYEPRLGESSLRPLRDGARIMRMYVRNLRWKPVTLEPVSPLQVDGSIKFDPSPGSLAAERSK